MGQNHRLLIQFSTQGLCIRLELCVVQKDLEVLQQIDNVLWQPRSKNNNNNNNKDKYFIHV